MSETESDVARHAAHAVASPAVDRIDGGGAQCPRTRMHSVAIAWSSDQRCRSSRQSNLFQSGFLLQQPVPGESGAAPAPAVGSPQAFLPGELPVGPVRWAKPYRCRFKVAHPALRHPMRCDPGSVAYRTSQTCAPAWSRALRSPPTASAAPSKVIVNGASIAVRPMKRRRRCMAGRACASRWHGRRGRTHMARRSTRSAWSCSARRIRSNDHGAMRVARPCTHASRRSAGRRHRSHRGSLRRGVDVDRSATTIRRASFMMRSRKPARRSRTTIRAISGRAASSAAYCG